MKDYETMTRDVFQRMEEYRQKRRKTARIAASVCCVCFLALIGIGVGLWRSGLSTDDPSKGNHATMLFTVAKIVEVSSPQSVVAEVVDDTRYNPQDGTNRFAVGEVIRAEFVSSEMIQRLVPGDIVRIGRGNGAKIDYSVKPYVVQCSSIAIEAEEDFRNMKVDIDHAKTPEEAGLFFANERYGAHLMNLPEGNDFRITDYQTLDYSVLETTETSISAEFTIAVKAVKEASFQGPYTQAGTGEYAGWLILRKQFTLALRNNGYWNCIALTDAPLP